MQRCTSSRHHISASECEGCIKYAPQFHRVCSQLTDVAGNDIDPDYDTGTKSMNSMDYMDPLYMEGIRATFALDKILYRDTVIEVNPGGIYFVRSKKWLDITEITQMFVKLRVKTPLLKPTMLQRMSFNPVVRARTPANVVVPNVFFQIRNLRTVAACVERPLEVKEAVVQARNIVY